MKIVKEKKRERQIEDHALAIKRARRSVEEVTTPLVTLAYETQVDQKKDKLQQALERLAKETTKMYVQRKRELLKKKMVEGQGGQGGQGQGQNQRQGGGRDNMAMVNPAFFLG